MSEPLKPCPFCGGPPLVKPVSTGHEVRCVHDECPVIAWVIGSTPEDAVEHWNRRVTPASENLAQQKCEHPECPRK